MALVFYWLGMGLLVYTFLLYPLLLLFLWRFSFYPDLIIQSGFCPPVSLIIAAYNEENVIRAKLDNCLNLDYPQEKLEIIVASDCSDDRTDQLVREYEAKGVKLCTIRPRGGKTNAQNRAVEMATNEILCFSDANSFWKDNALKELVRYFTDPRVAYVCGRLSYCTDPGNDTRTSEGMYWNYELKLRELEAEIYSVTGGNGGIYAIRREDFLEIDPFYSHDLYYPQLMVRRGRLALYAKNAIAEEKSSDNIGDELKRRVRMMGRTWLGILRERCMFRLFKQKKIYSLMFFSHRFLRYLLPFWLLLIFISNWVLAVGSDWYLFSFLLQLIFYFLACLGFLSFKGKLFFVPLYLSMFAVASLWGLARVIRGKVKPYWEQAASTRR